MVTALLVCRVEDSAAGISAPWRVRSHLPESSPGHRTPPPRDRSFIHNSLSFIEFQYSLMQIDPMYRILSIDDLQLQGYTVSDIRCARACCLIRLSPEVYVVKKSCSVHHRSPLPATTTVDAASGDGSASPVVRSHIEAAAILGLTIAYPVSHHVEVADPRAGRRSLRALAGGALIPAHHRCRIGGTTVTTVERTLIDVARSQGLDISVAMIDDALHRGLTTLDKIRVTLAQCLEGRKSQRVRLALDLCDFRRGSPEESITAVRFHQFGLIGFEPHTEVSRSRSAHDIHVGFCHRAARLIVEVEGINASHHDSIGSPGELEQWPQHVSRVHVQGMRIIRLTWSDLFEEEKFVQIRQHLCRCAEVDGGRARPHGARAEPARTTPERYRRSVRPQAEVDQRRGAGP